MMSGLTGGATGAPATPTPAAADSEPTAEVPPASAPPTVPPGMQGLLGQLEGNEELQKMRDDPRLADFFADMERDGMAGAMRHMGNPAVMEMISKAMGSLAPPS